MVLPCGYTDLMEFIELKENIMEWIRWLFGGQKSISQNLFTYYEQNMTKFVLLLDYYNNVYEGHYEKW